MLQNPFTCLLVSVSAENLHTKFCPASLTFSLSLPKFLSLSEQLLFAMCLYLIGFPWINWRTKERRKTNARGA